MLLLLPLLALAEAWMHPFHFPWRLHVEQQYEAVVHTPAGSRLALLAVFSLLLMDGHAQVLLLQHPPSVTRKRFRTASIECNVQGIGNIQNVFIHWYRHLPDRAPERILYVIGVSQMYYDSYSYKKKYSSYKKENKICILSILNIRYNDEGTYYCTYWEYHRGSNSYAGALQQSPVSITKPENKTVLITCRISIPSFDKEFIHWYRQSPGTAPKRIAYMATRLFLDSESEEGKFSMEKDLDESQCTLTVGRVTLHDAATYYCARWDAQQQTAIGNLHKDTLCSSTRP
ncbi:hypothetical protein ASZ78_003481 [Callipepla squamata]|uniref:Ig-like domain-containing protein n=1 Tax=Callipepla squamata TaxID=9009 RepID=A0A226MI04_CALSU|nr:hypothetical protein ASZ78_003481 [Callipepla squamata]